LWMKAETQKDPNKVCTDMTTALSKFLE